MELQTSFWWTITKNKAWKYLQYRVSSSSVWIQSSVYIVKLEKIAEQSIRRMFKKTFFLYSVFCQSLFNQLPLDMWWKFNEDWRILKLDLLKKVIFPEKTQIRVIVIKNWQHCAYNKQPPGMLMSYSKVSNSSSYIVDTYIDLKYICWKRSLSFDV